MENNALPLWSSISVATAALMAAALGYVMARNPTICVGAVALAAILLVPPIVGPRRSVLLALVFVPFGMFPQLGLPLGWIWVFASLLSACAAAAISGHWEMSPVSMRPAYVVLPCAWLMSASASSLTDTGASHIQLTHPTLIAILVSLLFYWLVTANLWDEAWVRRGIEAWAVSAALLAVLTAALIALPKLYGVPGMPLGGEYVRYAGAGSFFRAYSPLGDYELFSEFCALSGVVAVSFLTAPRRSTRSRVFWMCVVLADCVGLLLSGTRGGLITFGAGLLLLATCRRVPSGRVRLALIVLLLIAMFIVGVRSAGVLGGLGEHLLATQTGSGLTTMLDRGGLWGQFLPFHGSIGTMLLGFGTNFRLDTWPALPDMRAWPTLPHSLYVYVLNTQGLIGFLVLASLLVALVRPFFSAALAKRPWSDSALVSLLILLFALDEVKIEFLRLPSYQVVVWGLFGLCAAAERASRMHESRKPRDRWNAHLLSPES